MQDVNNILEQYGELKSKYSTNGTPFQMAVGDFQAKKIKEMQKNLSDSKRVSSRKLSQSLVPVDVEVDKDGNVLIEWGGEDYAKFIDEGVNGLLRKFGSAYSFSRPKKTSSIPRNSFYTSIRDWMKFKGISSINFRDQNGRMKTKWLKTEKDYKQGAFVLIRSIQNNGIKPSYFIDHAFDKENKVVKEFETLLFNEWQSL